MSTHQSVTYYNRRRMKAVNNSGGNTSNNNNNNNSTNKHPTTSSIQEATIDVDSDTSDVPQHSHPNDRPGTSGQSFTTSSNNNNNNNNNENNIATSTTSKTATTSPTTTAASTTTKYHLQQLQRIQQPPHQQQQHLATTSQNTVESQRIVMSPMRSPYSRTRSKSYGGQKIGGPDPADLQQINQTNHGLGITNFSFGSFGMPQNISQVLPNLNSLPEYLTSVSIPSMPTISMPTISMPALPNLPNLSMPNISMPSMPSIPSMANINIPSISEIMNFPGRKIPKSWQQICQSVKESRERFSEVCPSIPFCINFRYNALNGCLRIYFLASLKSSETTLFYCDVPKEGASTFTLSSMVNRPVFEIDEEMLLDSDMEHESSHPSTHSTRPFQARSFQQPQQHQAQNLYNPRSFSRHSNDLDIDNIDFMGQHAPKVMKRGGDSSASSSSRSCSPFMDQEQAAPESRSNQVASPNSSVPDCESLLWQPLLARQTTFNRSFDEDDPFALKSDLSREEDLILERKRMPYSGLVSYDFHPEAARIVYTVKNMIYWFDDLEILNKNYSQPRYIPQKLMTNSLPKTNATICPINADFVAYVADNDLWACNLITGDDVRLTSFSKMKAMSAGQPSFVMQEEFSRYEGFWWRPQNPDSSTPQQSRYYLLCEFLDEQNIPITCISNWEGSAEFHYFPRPGGMNAASSLGLVSFSYNEISPQKRTSGVTKQWSVQVERLSPLEELFPEYEYLVKCGWLNCDVIWVQLLNRKQTKLVIGLISITHSFPSQILFEEEVKSGWYNCHNNLYFYSHDHIKRPEDVVNFLWSSEETGYRHLYRISCKLQPFPVKQQEYEGVPPEVEISHFKATVLSSQQITSGAWEVYSEGIWVDEVRDLIYFVGNKQSPLEAHLYCVSSKYTSRSMPRRVTQEDYTHGRVHFDSEFNYCIDFQSNLSKPPFGFLHRVKAPEASPHLVNFEPLNFFLSPPNDMTLGDIDEYYDKVQTLGPSPQLFECKLECGELIYGFFFKPDIVEPGVKYPVLLDIYGGPEIQVVSKSFKDVRHHRRHMLASEGYVVVGFDSRGSKNRGVAFEQHIHKRLGQVEIHDQVQVLEWLAEKTGFIDMSRVAIHGWSYGGYLSLMALTQRPDIFKLCIAGAPVTNWLLYDTAYTERYMGLPDENPLGYRASSVLSHVRNFPDEQNRLLIIHGLMDENVHFAHTAQLINALVKAGKPYNLNVFPFERHCLRKSYCSEHYEATLLFYLQQNL